MTGAFGQHRAEAHFGHHGADAVRVDQLRIAECAGPHAERALDGLHVQAHLLLEVLLRGERRQRVGVGFGQELHASRVGQLAERREHLGRIGPHLLDGDARDRERAAEAAFVFADQLQQQGIHRQIAAAGDLLHDRTVLQIIQVVVVLAHAEEAVTLQTPGLMHLEIETNGFHRGMMFIFRLS